jgi:hypothetical protein
MGGGERAGRTFGPGPWIMGIPHILSFNLKIRINVAQGKDRRRALVNMQMYIRVP